MSSGAQQPWLGSTHTAFVFGTFALHELHWLVCNGLLALLDASGWLRRYRIQGDRFPPRERIPACLALVAFNHFCVQLPGLLMVWPVILAAGGRVDASTDTLPCARVVACQLLFWVLLEDTLFYWVHRGLHHRSIYKHIHKIHHQYRTPIGIASEYCHPLEYLVANTTPFMAGPLLCTLPAMGGLHVGTLWVWLVLRLTEATEGHSGYELPFSPFGWYHLRVKVITISNLD